MKNLFVFLFAVAFVLGLVGHASATTYTDTYDAGSDYVHFGDSVSWTFDITDDGFDPNDQDVTSAEVVLNLSDDSDWDWIEIAIFTDGTDYGWWEVDDGDFSFAITSLVTLSDSGTADCTLTVIWGDFNFNSATLYAEGTESSTAPIPNPEPGTMLLLGTGLVGLAGFGRKKLFKKA